MLKKKQRVLSLKIFCEADGLAARTEVCASKVLDSASGSPNPAFGKVPRETPTGVESKVMTPHNSQVLLS